MAVTYSVHTNPGRLDSESAAYLKDVEATAGLGKPGIFVKRPISVGGPRSGWWFWGMLGLGLLGLAAYLCVVAAQSEVGAQPPAVLRAIFLGMGAFLLLIGILRFRRIPPPWQPKNFIYADANFFWDVLPSRIKTVDLSNLSSVSGVEHTRNGAYAHTSVKLEFAGVGQWSFDLANKTGALQFLKFFQYVAAIRTSDQPQVRDLARYPGLLGTAAKGLAEGKDFATAVANPAADPPTPRVVEPDPLVPLYESRQPAMMCLLLAVGVGAIASIGIPRLDSYFQDEAYYAAVKQGGATDTGDMDRYLAAFPFGRHAAAVSVMRDDQRFALARAQSEQDASPGGLRGYLADASNVRHRAEAQALIGKYYDKVIADLKARQADANSKVDPKLLDGIVALLQGLKTADRPVVTVGFRSDVDTSPQSDDAKDEEKGEYAQEQKDHPELQSISDSSPEHTAIISPGQVFDPGQMSSREAMIIGRLRDAVQKGIKADILTLEPAPFGTQPTMEVYYHVTDDGSLGIYTSTLEDGTKKTKGLLRWYGLDWTITFHPAGMTKPYLYALSSQPGASLHYDRQEGDPDWAIYSVLLYSGFYDMGAQLIKGFGQDPGVAPDEFSFTDAVGQYKPDTDLTPPTP